MANTSTSTQGPVEGIFLIDNRSSIPLEVSVKNGNLKLPIRCQLEPNKRFTFSSFIEYEVGVGWYDFPALFFSDMWFLFCCTFLFFAIPLTILTKDLGNLQKPFLFLWAMIVTAVYVFCRCRSHHVVLVNKFAPGNVAFEFCQTRSLIEGLLTHKHFHSVERKKTLI